MRTISISTAVFARIWAERQHGEETEDAILRRLLGCRDIDNVTTTLAADDGADSDGVHIPRFNVHFPEGSEIFRTYKGERYRVRATKGKWLLLNNGQLYPSLHKLSCDLVQGHENAWVNWKYVDKDDQERFIDALRDEERVDRRT